MFGELLRYVGMILGSLVHQVFKQVRHPGLTVVFVPRSDHVSDIDRYRFLRLIREKQNAESVWETVLGEAFDRGYQLDILWKRSGLLRACACRRTPDQAQQKHHYYPVTKSCTSHHLLYKTPKEMFVVPPSNGSS